MTTFTAITNGEIDQDSPITTTLMTKYRDNLAATAEGASGAPRIADKVTGGEGASVTLTGLDDFSGIWLTGSSSNSSPSPFSITISISDDGGSTTLSSASIFSLSGNDATLIFFQVFVDFPTGNYFGVSNDGQDYVSGTLASSSAAVNWVKVTGGSNGIAILANPQGGQSAS